MFRISRDEGTGAVRPFDDQHCTLRKVILPSNLKNVFLVLQTVQIHMHHHERRSGMLRHDAERRACHSAFCAKRGAQSLRERGFPRAQITFETDHIA